MLKCCFTASADPTHEHLSDGKMQVNLDKSPRGPVLLSSPDPGPAKTTTPRAPPAVSKTPIVASRSTVAAEAGVTELGSDVNSIHLSEVGAARPSHPSQHDSHQSPHSQQTCSPSQRSCPHGFQTRTVQQTPTASAFPNGHWTTAPIPLLTVAKMSPAAQQISPTTLYQKSCGHI